MRYVIGLSFAALAIWVLQATGVLMGLMMFLMLGTIPGTHVNVSPSYMMILSTLSLLILSIWFYRQRPVRQIQQMRQTYHNQVSQNTPATRRTKRREPLFAAGYRQSFATTRASTQHQKSLTVATARRTGSNMVGSTTKHIQPVRIFVIALIITTATAAHEIGVWVRPYLRRLSAWLRKQISYSVKGTMFSAHKWSSLIKKLLSALASLLSRCSSALKRGKSFFIRSSR
jgi:hypothetical protein